MRRRIATFLVLLGASVGTTRGDMLMLSGPSNLVPGGPKGTYFVQFAANARLTIESFDLVLGYDHLRLALSNPRLADGTSLAFSSTVNTSLTDRVILSASANSVGINVAANSTTPLFTFDAQLLPNAVLPTDLNLMANVASTFTSVNESLLLTPAPTNGFDPGIDIRITVPEPSAALLFAISLAGVAIRSRARRRSEAARDLACG